jgi:hypothetical protein
MPSEQIDGYEIEYAGMPLANAEGWGAQVAIFAPSSNPMHRNCVFAEQRVALETVFPTQAAAEEAAHQHALLILKSGHSSGH